MKLIMKRLYPRPTYCISKLYWINGEGKEEYLMDVVEDRIVDKDKSGKFEAERGEVKVYAQSAIPYGKYTITLDVVSPKFSQKKFYYDNCDKGRVPRLLNVPHYEGILIHCGKNANSSAGCLIVGENKVVGGVVNSEQCFLRLYKLMKEHKQEGITIEII